MGSFQKCEMAYTEVLLWLIKKWLLFNPSVGRPWFIGDKGKAGFVLGGLFWLGWGGCFSLGQTVKKVVAS